MNCEAPAFSGDLRYLLFGGFVGMNYSFSHGHVKTQTNQISAQLLGQSCGGCVDGWLLIHQMRRGINPNESTRSYYIDDHEPLDESTQAIKQTDR